MAFDPSSAQPAEQSQGFDPTTAKPVTVGFDPTTAKPAASWSNLGAGLAGAYKEGVAGGLLFQPLRYAMEHADAVGLPVYGMDRIKQLYPGQSDEFYKQKIHDIYGQAVQNSRQAAQEQTANNPYPGHQVANFAANVLGSADPTWLVAPGASGLAKGAFDQGIVKAAPAVAAFAARRAAVQAALGSASNAAAQAMDMAEGQKKDFDIKQNLESAAMGGAFGAAHAGLSSALAHPVVSDFVSDLFKKRGVDTLPPDNPTQQTTPLTGDSVKFTPEEATQFKQLLKTGTVDQIKQFIQAKNGPKPSWSQVNDMVEMRDKMPDQFVGQDNFNQAMDQAIDEHQRGLVSDHIDAQTANWTNKPDVELINHVNDIADPAVREQAIKDGAQENGIGFLGADGKVRIFANRVHSPDQVNAVLYHEALGHYGLAQQFGDKLDSTLQTLLDRNVGQFSKDVDAWQKANPDAYGGDRVRAAEEVLAEKSQNGQLKPSLMDAVVAHVRNFGRKMGLDLSYSDNEVQHILSMAHDAVINGKPNDAVGNRFGGSVSQPVSEPTEWQGNKALQQTTNRAMTRTQLAASEPDYQIKQVEKTYEADKDFVPEYRSNAEVIRAARDQGFSTSQVKSMGDMQDLAKRNARMTFAAKVLDQKLTDIENKMFDPQTSVSDYVKAQDNYRQAIVDHAYILNKIRGDRSEIARALQVSKLGYTRAQMESFGELLKEQGGTFEGLGDDDTLLKFARQMQQIRQGGANPAGVNKMVSNLSKHNWEDYLTSFHTNMMLSGLSTHVKAPQDMIIGIARDLMNNTGALVHTGAVNAMNALGADLKPGVHPAEPVARLWGLMRAVMDANTWKNAAAAFNSGGVNPSIGGKPAARLPGPLNIPMDAIATQDSFFRAVTTNMHLYGLGVRDALNDARASGKTLNFDDALTDGVNRAQSPSPSLLKAAKAASDQTLLLNKNMLTEPLDRLKSTTPNSSGLRRATAFVANFLTPFIRVESNSLYNRIVRNSPLTLLDPQTLKDLKTGGPEAGTALARIAFGFATFASAWSAAKKGVLTGQGPDNANKRAEMEASGWRPDAVHENDQYNTGNALGSSINPLDVHNKTATMIADMREAYEKGASAGQVASGVGLAIYSIMSDMAKSSWMGDVQPAIEAATSRGADGSHKMAQFAGNELATMSPNFMSQIARVTDQNQPDLRDQPMTGPLQATVPGLRQQLPVRQTPYGDPVQGGASMAGQHNVFPQDNRITGGNHVNETQDPVEKEMTRISSQMSEALITPVQRTITINGVKQKLTTTQLSEYQHLVGQNIKAYVAQEMSTPEWQQMSDNDRAYTIRDIEKDMKKGVKEQLYGQ